MSNSRSRHRFSRRPTIGWTPRTSSSSTMCPSDRPEREVGDRSVRDGADGHRDATHVVGERPSRRASSEGRPTSTRWLGRVRPGEVKVDDGLVPRGPCSDLDVQRLHEAVRYVHARELGHRAERGHDVRGPLVEGVVGDDERAPVHHLVGQVVQRVLAVVATGEHLEHRLPGGDRRAPAARTGTARSARVSRPASRSARPGPRASGSWRGRSSSSRTPANTSARTSSTSGCVEPAEPDAAREVADHREPQLGGLTKWSSAGGPPPRNSAAGAGSDSHALQQRRRRRRRRPRCAAGRGRCGTPPPPARRCGPGR